MEIEIVTKPMGSYGGVRADYCTPIFLNLHATTVHPWGVYQVQDMDGWHYRNIALPGSYLQHAVLPLGCPHLVSVYMTTKASLNERNSWIEARYDAVPLEESHQALFDPYDPSQIVRTWVPRAEYSSKDVYGQIFVQRRHLNEMNIQTRENTTTFVLHKNSHLNFFVREYD